MGFPKGKPPLNSQERLFPAQIRLVHQRLVKKQSESESWSGFHSQERGGRAHAHSIGKVEPRARLSKCLVKTVPKVSDLNLEATKKLRGEGERPKKKNRKF